MTEARIPRMPRPRLTRLERFIVDMFRRGNTRQEIVQAYFEIDPDTIDRALRKALNGAK